MHKKFKDKIEANILLEEIEQAKDDIYDLYRTSRLLENYCDSNSNITEIDDMKYIIKTFKNNLFCLFKSMENIVNKNKCQNRDFWDNFSSSFSPDDVILDDD